MILDQLGLVAAIERLLEELRNSGTSAIDLDASDVAGVRMNAELESTAFRILQEAISNSLRHLPQNISVSMLRFRTMSLKSRSPTMGKALMQLLLSERTWQLRTAEHSRTCNDLWRARRDPLPAQVQEQLFRPAFHWSCGVNRMNEIRVLVADDHAVLRSGLKLLISTQPDMVVVGEAGDFLSAREKIRRCVRML